MGFRLVCAGRRKEKAKVVGMDTTLYMAVTPDKLELPLFVAGNVRELANKYGVMENAVYSSIARNESGKQRGAKFIKVKMAKEEENNGG